MITRGFSAVVLGEPFRLARLCFCLLGLGLLLGLASAGWAKEDKPADEGQEPARLPDHPTIIIEDFHGEVHNAGVKRQELNAKWGRLDEKENILDLRSMRVRFFDEGTTRGEAVSGIGRVWLTDRPSEKIARNDLLLGGTVTYRMQTDPKSQGALNSGWLLRTPQMHYTATDSMLRSNKGFIKQMPMRDGYLIGRGQGFELKLLLEKNSFEYWKEYGNPVVLEKSKKPELIP